MDKYDKTTLIMFSFGILAFFLIIGFTLYTINTNNAICLEATNNHEIFWPGNNNNVKSGYVKCCANHYNEYNMLEYTNCNGIKLP